MRDECFFEEESMKNPFKALSKFEMVLWILSVITVTVSYLLCPSGDIFSLIASVIGVTALIFVSKGFVFGQILIIIFATLYGLISLKFRYYGEMITYVGMSLPMAIISLVSWLRHPFKKTKEVEVNKITSKHIVCVILLSLTVMVTFYFVLKWLDTPNLIFSTISVATSFFASSLTFLRSPYYALAYSVNDVVLIILWILASVKDISYLPMIACFVAFLFNDLYGFYNWKRMQKRQLQSK